MLVIGLTGSIGMGKSTTAGFFRAFGVPVHDSDAAVHEAYRSSGTAAIEANFPGSTVGGAVDRAVLSRMVLGDPAALARLEAIVHPLVAQARQAFLAAAAAGGRRIVVVDVPLLFEGGLCGSVDVVAVVTAPEAVQKARVMSRPGMTAERFGAILAQQMPDEEKRRRAHFLIETSRGLADARDQVADLLRAVAAVPGRPAAGQTSRKTGHA